jgi:hypothetical protein
MAAYAGLEPPEYVPLTEQVQQQPSISQLICYHRGNSGIRRPPGEIKPTDGVVVCEVPVSEVPVAPEGELFKCVFTRSITTTGLELAPEVEEQLKDLTRQWMYGNIR